MRAAEYWKHLTFKTQLETLNQKDAPRRFDRIMDGRIFFLEEGGA